MTVILGAKIGDHKNSQLALGKWGESAMQGTPSKITFEYKISQNFSVYSVTGAIGGLNAKGQVIVNFFSERSAIPKTQTYNVKSDGSLEDHPVTEERKETLIRDVMFGISMAPDTARSIAQWLIAKANQHEELFKQSKEKTDKLRKIHRDVLDFDFPGRIKPERALNDYTLLMRSTAIGYNYGYFRGFIVVHQLTKEPETMDESCQVFDEGVTLDSAKIQIKSFFEEHHGKTFDYVDIREALCIPLPIIVEACEQLEKEGKIAGVD